LYADNVTKRSALVYTDILPVCNIRARDDSVPQITVLTNWWTQRNRSTSENVHADSDMGPINRAKTEHLRVFSTVNVRQRCDIAKAFEVGKIDEEIIEKGKGHSLKGTYLKAIFRWFVTSSSDMYDGSAHALSIRCMAGCRLAESSVRKQ
jgi:hypothetical protein